MGVYIAEALMSSWSSLVAERECEMKRTENLEIKWNVRRGINIWKMQEQSESLNFLPDIETENRHAVYFKYK